MRRRRSTRRADRAAKCRDLVGLAKSRFRSGQDFDAERLWPELGRRHRAELVARIDEEMGPRWERWRPAGERFACYLVAKYLEMVVGRVAS